MKLLQKQLIWVLKISTVQSQNYDRRSNKLENLDFYVIKLLISYNEVNKLQTTEWHTNKLKRVE